MDENKITPELDNSAETENAQEQPVTENAETVDENAVETSAETETQETETDVIVESDVIEAVAEEEIDLGKPETPKKKKRKGLKIVLGIFIAIVLCFVGLIVAAIIYVNSNTPKLSVDVDEVAVSVGDAEVNAGEYLYVYSYYNSYYSSYYTPEQIVGYATEQLVYVNSLYKKAVESGYTLDEKDYAEINDTIASVEKQAEEYSITTDEMIEKYYFCDGYTLDMFKKYLEKEYLANKYYNDEVEKIQSAYKGDNALEIMEKEYKSDKVTYDLSNASYAYFDATEEGVQDKVDAIISKVNSGTAFADAVGSADDVKSLKSYTKAVIESNFSADVAKWLFEIKDGAYVNGAGAVKSFTDSDVIYIVYINGEPYRNEEIPVTVDYIVVKADTDTTVKSESELLLAAKATASSIVKEFEATEKTANDFFSLADKHSKGENKLISADSYEKATSDAAYDEAVKAWMFDSARKVGDYALVEGDGCYYILYFTQKDDNAVWYQSVETALLNKDLTKWSQDITAAYKDVTTENEDVINAVVDYVKALSSSSSMMGY